MCFICSVHIVGSFNIYKVQILEESYLALGTEWIDTCEDNNIQVITEPLYFGILNLRRKGLWSPARVVGCGGLCYFRSDGSLWLQTRELTSLPTEPLGFFAYIDRSNKLGETMTLSSIKGRNVGKRSLFCTRKTPKSLESYCLINWEDHNGKNWVRVTLSQ